MPISALQPQTQGLLKARLNSIKAFHARRGLTVINAEFADQTGKIGAKWFNKVYLTRQLKPGNEYWLFGSATTIKNQLVLSNPEIEPVDNEAVEATNRRLTPVYPSNSRLAEARISPLSLRKLIDNVLDQVDWAASFPPAVQESSFRVIAGAIADIHRPESDEELKKAKHTLAFFDQVLFQMGVLKRRENITGYLTLPDAVRHAPADSLYPLPFQLTNGQKQALGEIIADLKPGSDRPPMNRLLQGDVGSGKTLVAFLAMIDSAIELYPGSQCAFMAPTEILARQHLQNFVRFFPQFARHAVIITGSMKTAERRPLNEAVATGQALFIFGTHALFQEQTQFNRLNFCIIDEQQRFGVMQRGEMLSRGKTPHLLMMSATPIPRTISACLFGDMDISVIRERPEGRQKIETRLIDFTKIRDLMQFMIDESAAGGRTYWICPRVEEDGENYIASVEKRYKFLKKHLGPLGIGFIHGKMDSEQKSRELEKFRAGEIKVLVGTTVLEVGVDVPEASVVVIESPERYGLSQLHQIRGRVGRGSRRGVCLLLVNKIEEDVADRLRIMLATDDGFKIAEADHLLRGPGKISGYEQHGASEFRTADIFRDSVLLKRAREDAQFLVSDERALLNEKGFKDKLDIYLSRGTSVPPKA